jgi:hypothetical protein
VKRGLSRRWIEWRRRRYQQLQAEGIPSHLAWQIAKAEVNARRKVAQAKGLPAAERVSLVSRDDGDQCSFAIVSPLASSEIVEVEARRGRRVTVLDNPA